MMMVIAPVSLLDSLASVLQVLPNEAAGNRHVLWKTSLKRRLAAAGQGLGRRMISKTKLLVPALHQLSASVG
jgi:hypothetical protein